MQAKCSYIKKIKKEKDPTTDHTQILTELILLITAKSKKAQLLSPFTDGETKTQAHSAQKSLCAGLLSAPQFRVCLPSLGWVLGGAQFSLNPSSSPGSHVAPVPYPFSLPALCSPCHCFSAGRVLFSQRFPLSSFSCALQSNNCLTTREASRKQLEKVPRRHFFFLAPLSIRGLWSPSNSSCLQEPSLNQYFDVKSMFSTAGFLWET